MKIWMMLAVVAACGSEPSPPEDRSTLSAERSALRVGVRRLDHPATFGDEYYPVHVVQASSPCLVTDETLVATWNGVPMTIVTHAGGTVAQCVLLELAVARADVAGGDARIEIEDQHGAIDGTFSATAFDTGTTVPITPVWQLVGGSDVVFRWSRQLDREVKPSLCFLRDASRWCIEGRANEMRDDLTFEIPAQPAVTGEGVARLSGIGSTSSSSLDCHAVGCSLTLPQETTHAAIVTMP